jgi:hypothetical protein
MLKVEDAKKELSQKTYAEIQEETAWKWASRAAASYQNVEKAEDAAKFEAYLLAQEYEHEAIEHAALISDPDENLVKKVQEAIAPYSQDAWHDLQLAFFL